jgi:serine/threonine protein kinase
MMMSILNGVQTNKNFRISDVYNFSYRIENDMWSLGVITFTLLSGMAPFDG